MAKKVDLEAAFRKYSDWCAEAARAEVDRDYPRLLTAAEATLPLVREAIAYLRRYQKVEAPRLRTVEQIFRFAPPLFAMRSLDAVEAWLAQLGRTERRAYPDLADQARAARRHMALATRIWPSWRAGELKLAPGDDPGQAAQLVNFWIGYGAVIRHADRTPPAYQLVTHPQQQVRGKCAGCGHETQTQWVELLEPKVCSHCLATTPFAILARLA